MGGGHWHARHRAVEAIHLSCAVAFGDGRTPFRPPVRLSFEPVTGPKRRRLDLINYAVTAKSIEDAIVRMGLLPDDSFKTVAEIRILAPIRGDSDGMWVTVEPV